MSNWKKLMVGGGITALLIAVIWFPLILFAYSTSYGRPNIPQVVVVNFQFGTYDPVYKAEVMHANIHQFTRTDWNTLMSIYDKNPTAKAFLEDFEPDDVVAINLVSDSSTMWSVSPPNAKQMIKEIKNGKLKSCRFEYRISRNSLLIAGLEEIKGEVEYKLDEEVRENLIAMLSSSAEAKPVLIPSIFPKLMLAKNKGNLEPISDLIPFGKNLFLKNAN
jgi:Piezo non-specific cation channel, R-Ras-binding domain